MTELWLLLLCNDPESKSSFFQLQQQLISPPVPPPATLQPHIVLLPQSIAASCGNVACFVCNIFGLFWVRFGPSVSLVGDVALSDVSFLLAFATPATRIASLHFFSFFFVCSLFGFFFWSTVFCLLALLGPSYVETAKNRLLHCPNNCRWLWRRRRQRQRRRRRLLLLLSLPIMRHVPHVLQLVGVDTPSHGALKSVTVLDRKLLTKVQLKLKT